MNTLLINETYPGVAAGGPPKPPLAVDPGVNAPSQLGGTVRIEGEIHGQQDLLVDGEVNGSVILPGHTLTIGPKAHVKASIKAQNVILLGNLEGNIEATGRIELRGRCSLLGDIRSPRIMIENGAYVKGMIEVIRPAPVTPATPAVDLNGLTTAVSSLSVAIDRAEMNRT